MAGRYRKPSYGVEYRTLSNFWLNSPELVGWIYDIVKLSFSNNFWKIDPRLEQPEFVDKIFNSGGKISDYHYCSYDYKLLQKAINENDKLLGKQFLSLIKQFMPLKFPKITNNLYNSWKIKLF